MPDPGGPFSITQFDRLRASESIHDAWSHMGNDEFHALVWYVSAATGVGLEGYRRLEPPDAIERLHRTFDELEVVIEVLNSMQLLRQPREALLQQIHPTIDLIQQVNRLLEPRVSSGLRELIVGELKRWITGTSSTGSLSDLIKYEPAEER